MLIRFDIYFLFSLCSGCFLLGSSGIKGDEWGATNFGRGLDLACRLQVGHYCSRIQGHTGRYAHTHTHMYNLCLSMSVAGM